MIPSQGFFMRAPCVRLRRLDCKKVGSSIILVQIDFIASTYRYCAYRFVNSLLDSNLPPVFEALFRHGGLRRRLDDPLFVVNNHARPAHLRELFGDRPARAPRKAA